MRDIVAPLLSGAVFGFALGWAHLYDPSVIYEMLKFRDLYVYLIMGSAILTAAIGVRLLRAGRVVSPFACTPVSWRPTFPGRQHWIGGALFGLGWGITCMCPGPIAIQAVRGEWPGLLVAAGVLVGIAGRDAIIGPPMTAPAPPSPAANPDEPI